MPRLGVGAGLGVLAAVMAVALPDIDITVPAAGLPGAGDGQTTGTTTATGAAVPYSRTLVNISKAPITRSRMAFAGYALQSAVTNVGAPLAIPGNDTPLSGMTIEYPVGTVIGTYLKSASGSFSVPSNSDIVTSDELTHTSIPVGATYKVNWIATVPNGQKLLHNGGFWGHLTTAKQSLLNPIRALAFGDSIANANGKGIFRAGAAAQFPVIQAAIGGTRGFDYVSVLPRLTKLAQDLGCTHFEHNYGTNDWGAGRTEAQVASMLASWKSAGDAAGLVTVWAGTLPQSGITRVSVVSAVVDSAPEPVLTVTVAPADMARFEDAGIYNIISLTSGTALNGSWYFTKASPTTLTAPAPASLAGTVGGGPGLIGMANARYASTRFQVPLASPATIIPAYETPTVLTSPRANINARGKTGEFGLYVDIPAAVEVGLTNRWQTRENQPNAFFLDDVQLTVGSAILTANRFSFSPSQISNRLQGGQVVFLTGPNRGLIRDASGSQTTDVSVSAFPNIPATGDVFIGRSGSAQSTADGTHPSSSAPTGGAEQAVINAVTAFNTTVLGAI